MTNESTTAATVEAPVKVSAKKASKKAVKGKKAAKPAKAKKPAKAVAAKKDGSRLSLEDAANILLKAVAKKRLDRNALKSLISYQNFTKLAHYVVDQGLAKEEKHEGERVLSYVLTAKGKNYVTKK